MVISVAITVNLNHTGFAVGQYVVLLLAVVL